MQHVVDRFRRLKLAVFTLGTLVAIGWLWAPQPGAPALAIEPRDGAPAADAGIAEPDDAPAPLPTATVTATTRAP